MNLNDLYNIAWRFHKINKDAGCKTLLLRPRKIFVVLKTRLFYDFPALDLDSFFGTAGWVDKATHKLSFYIFSKR